MIYFIPSTETKQVQKSLTSNIPLLKTNTGMFMFVLQGASTSMGLTSLKDWGYHYKNYRIYLFTDIQPFFFFFYFHGIVENKEQEKVPALMLHKEGNFLKAACLNIGSRHYSPFET